MSLVRCNYCERFFDTREEDHARYEYPLPIMCGDCVDNEEHEEKQRQEWQHIDQDESWIAKHF